jgi:hypothetical protein
MDKVTQKILTSTAAVSIAAAKRKVVRIDVGGGGEGRVGRLFVKQNTGTPVGFSVRLLSSSVPYGDGTETPAAYNAAVSGVAELYDVLPQQTATSGNSVDVRRTADGDPYINADASSPSNRASYLYLVIIPTNSVDTSTWDVCLITLATR